MEFRFIQSGEKPYVACVSFGKLNGFELDWLVFKETDTDVELVCNFVIELVSNRIFSKRIITCNRTIVKTIANLWIYRKAFTAAERISIKHAVSEDGNELPEFITFFNDSQYASYKDAINNYSYYISKNKIVRSFLELTKDGHLWNGKDLVKASDSEKIGIRPVIRVEKSVLVPYGYRLGRYININPENRLYVSEKEASKHEEKMTYFSPDFE